LQRKISEREKRDSYIVAEQTQWPELQARVIPNQPTHMVWNRDSAVPKQKAKEVKKQDEQTSKPTLAQRLGGQGPSSSENSALSIKEQKAELKKSLKKKIAEF
jgi:hypothetical protein